MLTLLCIFTFVKTADDLWVYGLIMSAGTLLSQSIVWVILKKYVSFAKPSLDRIKENIKPLFTLFVPIIAVSIYKTMSKILLGRISDKAQVGYFESADKITQISLGFITAFALVMLPRMSNIVSSGDKDKGKRIMSASVTYMGLLSFALAFGLASIALEFSPIFFGKEFTASGPLIIGRSIAIPFFAFANVIRTQYLIPHNKAKTYIMAILAGAVLSVVINMLLIPHYQAMGAVVAVLLAEVCVCVVQVIAIRKELPVLQYIKKSTFFFIPGTIMFVSVRLMNALMSTSILTLALRIAVGAAVYLGISAIYLHIKKDELFVSTIKKVRNLIRGSSKA